MHHKPHLRTLDFDKRSIPRLHWLELLLSEIHFCWLCIRVSCSIWYNDMEMLILEYVDITSILPKGQTEVKLTLLGISNLADTMDSFCEFVMIGAGDVALLHFFICFYATISSVSSLGQALNGWLSVPIDWKGYFWSEKGIFFLIYKHHIYGSHMSEKYQKLLKSREDRFGSRWYFKNRWFQEIVYKACQWGFFVGWVMTILKIFDFICLSFTECL